MSHPEIFVQTTNLPPSANGHESGGGGAGGGDTPIESSISSADLSDRLHIDTSKIKEREDASLASNGDGAGGSADSAGGQQGLTQDSMNLVLLKRPVVEIPKSKVCCSSVVCSAGTATNRRFASSSDHGFSEAQHLVNIFSIGL